MKIGVIREGKTPPDFRVPLTPNQAAEVIHSGFDILIQPSLSRCFKDDEYEKSGLRLNEDLSDRDVLLGVKEVPIDTLIPGKTYFFFSHTIKQQAYNRDLLRAVLDKKIRLIDWETLTDEKGARVIAFGRWAGIVGAHNGIRTWGLRHQRFDLKPMNQCHDFAEAKSLYHNLPLGSLSIVLTGNGRVSNGSAEVLEAMGVKKVDPEAFLRQSFAGPIYTQLGLEDMYRHPEHDSFDMQHYFQNFREYETRFKPFTKCADLMINGIYWEPGVPAFFGRDQMKHPDFTVQVIADITCDIAPDASLPSTLRPSTISDPIYGFNPVSGVETDPFQNGVVDVMAVDNLPNELPRDASEDFGRQFLNHVFPELQKETSAMLDRATIAQDGMLTEPYRYLSDFVSGE